MTTLKVNFSKQKKVATAEVKLKQKPIKKFPPLRYNSTEFRRKINEQNAIFLGRSSPDLSGRMRACGAGRKQVEKEKKKQKREKEEKEEEEPKEATSPLPPKTTARAAARAVRSTAAALAWASGDGNVLSTAEKLIARLHPEANQSQLMPPVQGPYNIPTLPPRALLRARSNPSELLIEALQKNSSTKRECNSQWMKRYLDAVIKEYVIRPAAKRDQPPQARCHPRPRDITRSPPPPQPTRAAVPASTLAPATRHKQRISLSPLDKDDYEAMLKKVQKPLFSKRMLLEVQKMQMIRTAYSLPPEKGESARVPGGPAARRSCSCMRALSTPKQPASGSWKDDLDKII